MLRGPCLITPWDAGPWGGYDDTATPLSLVDRIDVLFVGTGTSIAPVPKAFREALDMPDENDIYVLLVYVVNVVLVAVVMTVSGVVT